MADLFAVFSILPSLSAATPLLRRPCAKDWHEEVARVRILFSDSFSILRIVESNTDCHSVLLKEPDSTVAEKLPVVPAYKGTVEFITLDDWKKELKVLVEECSTQEKYIYSIRPIDDTSEAYQAWQKIEQVYGYESMEAFCRQPTESVFQRLANDPRVRSLLSSSDPTREYNAIEVDAGEVVPASDEAKELLKPFQQMKGRTRNKKKKWATTFRQKINSYVYRKGNGREPQTWPLIRKVTLEGP